jgi:hypothetical protein
MQNLTVWQDKNPKYQSRFPRQKGKSSCLKLTYFNSKNAKNSAKSASRIAP